MTPNEKEMLHHGAIAKWCSTATTFLSCDRHDRKVPPLSPKSTQRIREKTNASLG